MKNCGVLTLASLLFLVGCGSDNQFIAPPAPEVTVASPETRTVTIYTDYPGKTVAVEEVEIRARVKGFLRSIEFEPGEPVKKGDLLFTIEPESFEAALNSAKASRAQAEAALELAKAKLLRVEKAFETNAVSEIEVLASRAELSEAEAALLSAEAAVDAAKIDLDYTTIHSPIDGRVSRNLVNVGNLVGSAESTLLATVVKGDPLYAYFSVDERTLLEYISNGRPKRGTFQARLQLTDGTFYEEMGEVTYAGNRVDDESGTLEVRALFPNKEEKLFAGIFVRVGIPEEVADATLVPELAVQRDLEGKFVYVVNAENVVERRDVRVGSLVEDRYRVILEGLEPSEKVIVNGLQRVREGIAVAAKVAASGAEK